MTLVSGQRGVFAALALVFVGVGVLVLFFCFGGEHRGQAWGQGLETGLQHPTPARLPAAPNATLY